jgi:ATP-dependent exoDNAse (exonuclease V) beta subunit
LHGLLEGHRPGDRRSGRFAARARELLSELARELPGSARAAAVARAQELLAALVRGPLLERLEGLEPAIVARELPLLAPPDEEGSGPIGPYTGTLDLLYREGQRWVVADFKTDRSSAANPPALARYQAQLGRYRAALEQALGLPAGQVLLELWWLESGLIERLDDPRGAAPAP